MNMKPSKWGTAREIQEMAKPGDLIEFARTGYRHWAIYVGDGSVIHLSLPKKGLTGLTATIVKEPLAIVCESDKCRVNNLTEDAQKRKLKAFGPSAICKNAEAHLGSEQNYELFNNNCEFFVTSCRYGESFCTQVDNTGRMLNGLALVGLAVGGVSALASMVINKSKTNDKHRTYETHNRTQTHQDEDELE